jgi:riboflavin biosynthesis pyrimidine reductase
LRQPGGPGSSFVCLVDETGDSGTELPPEFRAIYGRWPLPSGGRQPYLYANFVISRDGKVSFNEPGKRSGGPISGFNRHDRWLMALLRARADAVLVGASVLDEAPRQRWTAGALIAEDAAAWEELRAAEGRQPMPLHVIVTRYGKVRRETPVIADANVPALIVSTEAGVAQARKILVDAPNVRYLATGDRIDFRLLRDELGSEFGVRTLLAEVGPRVYGALLEAGVVDDEFVTLSPIMAGNSLERPRLALVEGVAFDPDAPPRSRLLAVYRAGDHLFLHSRYSSL